jgi:hypothetical protein
MWYFLTLFASFIPVILRLLVSFDLPIQGYDIKDFLFAGLAMNLSNLSLIGHKEFDRKLAIALISMTFILLIGFLIGLFLFNEAMNNKYPLPTLQVFSFVFVGISVYMSREANYYVFNKIN